MRLLIAVLGFLLFTEAFSIDPILFYEAEAIHIARQKLGNLTSTNPQQKSGEHSQKMIQKSSELPQQVSYPIDDSIRVAQKALLGFFALLKGYISTEAFNAATFEQDLKYLENVFSSITALAAKAEHHKGIKKQFAFISRMFKTMKYSTKRLKYLSLLEYPGSRLIYKATEVSVRALQLFDSYGDLDLSIYNIADHVVKLENSLNYWKSRFEQLSGISPSRRRAFDTRYDRVSTMLSKLKCRLPGQGYHI